MNVEISVCLIVKNEENNIERCLNSVLSIAKEIIIVDTGSNDNTKEISKKYGKVIDYEWENDFSKARNESIKYAKSDWILIIDADEELTKGTQKKIIPFLKEQPYKNNEPIIYKFKNKDIISENNYHYYYKHNIFRNNSGLYFEKSIHEQLTNSDKSTIEIKCPFFEVNHYINSTNEIKTSKKNKDYIDLLIKEINSNPNNMENYYYYLHLGNSYDYLNNPEKALDSYLQAYNLFKESSLNKKESIFGTILIAIITKLIHNFKLYEKAIPYIEEILEIDNNFPDALYNMGICYFHLNNLQKSKEYFSKVVNTFENTKEINKLGITSQGKNIFYKSKSELGRCNILSGDKKTGAFLIKEALEKSPKHFNSLLYLERFYLLEEKLKEAINYHITNFSYPDSEKEKLKKISELENSNVNYKKYLIMFLSQINKLNCWSIKEKELVNNKINYLKNNII